MGVPCSNIRRLPGFKEITCEVNGIIERHEIDGRIINIKAETVPASVAFKKKLQS